MAFPIDLYCNNTPGDVTSQSFYGSPVTGRATKRTRPHACGNTVWYHTKGDQALAPFEAYDGWGAMPFTTVLAPSGTVHPFPGLPRCPWY
ncbi:hypothetical protein GCM10020367_05530 [Streptomyces sannanensis]|uniref:Uncharacterized protein n=1 Tax=Streptomyces sannanensis TaxID=285536 RepID=A0ABP6S4Q3_9ACTN